MKKFLILFLLPIFYLYAGTITVSATVDGKGYKAKKKAKIAAQKEAIKNYTLSKNKNIPNDILEKLTNSYSEYIVFLTQNDISYDRSSKKTTANYTVEIDDQLFNNKFNSFGLSVQGQSTKLVILEEPLDMRNIDFFTDEDFVIYYQTLQKSIKDIINSKLSSNGFKVTNLLGSKKFDKFKSRSESLLGVYYDYKSSRYVKDTSFVSTVIQEYPDVIFIKYRLEFLILADSKISAKISMKISDVEGNYNISLGDLSYSTPLSSTSYNAIRNGFLQSAKNIISLLTNELNEKVDEVIVNKNNKPITFVLSLPDRRSAFKVKSYLSSVNKVFDIVLQNKEIIFYANKIDRDEFLYTQILPSVEDILNKTISDGLIDIRSKKVIINASDKEFNNNSELQILFI